jgi:hypothetical protein
MPYETLHTLAEEDILKVYGLHADRSMTKPIEFGGCAEVVRAAERFWRGVVTLPPEYTPWIMPRSTYC